MTARMRSRPGKRCQARYSSDFIAFRLLNRVMVLSIGRNYHIQLWATLRAPRPRNRTANFGPGFLPVSPRFTGFRIKREPWQTLQAGPSLPLNNLLAP